MVSFLCDFLFYLRYNKKHIYHNTIHIKICHNDTTLSLSRQQCKKKKSRVQNGRKSSDYRAARVKSEAISVLRVVAGGNRDRLDGNPDIPAREKERGAPFPRLGRGRRARKGIDFMGRERNRDRSGVCEVRVRPFVYLPFDARARLRTGEQVKSRVDSPPHSWPGVSRVTAYPRASSELSIIR